MNRGLIRGIAGQAEKYTPLIACDGTTQPFCDGGVWGRYSILPAERGQRICVGYADYLWRGLGASGDTSSGKQYYFSLPLPVMAGYDTPSTDYFIGGGMFGQFLAVNDTPGALYTLGGKTGTDGQGGANIAAAGLTAPGWAQLVIGHYFTGGSGSFSASTTKTQAHGLGQTPDIVQITSKDQATTGRISAGPTATDATNIYLTAQLSSSGSYYWWAGFTSGVILGPAAPFVFGSNYDHIEIYFMYPVA